MYGSSRPTNLSTQVQKVGGFLYEVEVATVNGATVITSDYEDCYVEISGVMHWNDSVSGQRGFGVFQGGTAGAMNGTEYSVFAQKSASGHFSVVYPPRVFHLTRGDSLTIGRYSNSGASFTAGPRFTWLTVKELWADDDFIAQ